MKKCFSFLFFLLAAVLHGQTLRVYDAFSQEPIYLVTIQEVGTEKGAVTDENGLAQLRGLGENSELILRHPDYETRTYSFKTLEKRNFILF